MEGSASCRSGFLYKGCMPLQWCLLQGLHAGTGAQGKGDLPIVVAGYHVGSVPLDWEVRFGRLFVGDVGENHKKEVE